MPTTHIPKETCLQFVKGSHQWGKWFHPKKFASHMSYSVDDEFGFEYEDVPNVDEEGYDILSWELEVNLCFIFYLEDGYLDFAVLLLVIHSKPCEIASLCLFIFNLYLCLFMFIYMQEAK